MKLDLEAINGPEAVQQLDQARAAAAAHLAELQGNKRTALENSVKGSGVISAYEANQAALKAHQETGDFPKIVLQ